MMMILVLTEDEILADHVRREANVIGHLVISAHSLEECRVWSKDVYIIVSDLRSNPVSHLEECLLPEEERMGKYIIGIGHSDLHSSEELEAGEFLDYFLLMPIDPSELAEALRTAGEKLEEASLKEMSGYDPIVSLVQDHSVLKDMKEILEEIRTRIGAGVPPHVIKWSVKTINMLDSSFHHRKEKVAFRALVNRVTEDSLDWAADLSSNSFLEIEEEHARIEDMINDLGEHFIRFLSEEEDSEGGMKEAIDDYLSLLEPHMEREEEVLFPFMDAVFTVGDRRFLSKAFLEIHRDLEKSRLVKRVEEIIRLSDTIRQKKNVA